MRLTAMAGIAESASAADCEARLPPTAPADYRELASLVTARWERSAGPRLVGLSGGQGTGKSTLARLLKAAGRMQGLRVVSLSLDDFYCTRAERRRRAAALHPLFEMRGPPGTHDLEWLAATITSLAGEAEVEVEIPVFDKGADDRAGTRRVAGGANVIVLEGWCIGALPISKEELAAPVNELERTQDPEGAWRAHVNEFVSQYARRVGERIDESIYLYAPGLESIRAWRLDQERERAPADRWDAQRIERFVEYYERWTESMRAGHRVKAATDWEVGLDASHRVSSLVLRE